MRLGSFADVESVGDEDEGGIELDEIGDKRAHRQNTVDAHLHQGTKILNAFDSEKRKCSDYRVRRGLSPATVCKVQVCVAAVTAPGSRKFA